MSVSFNFSVSFTLCGQITFCMYILYCTYIHVVVRSKKYYSEFFWVVCIGIPSRVKNERENAFWCINSHEKKTGLLTYILAVLVSRVRIMCNSIVSISQLETRPLIGWPRGSTNQRPGFQLTYVSKTLMLSKHLHMIRPLISLALPVFQDKLILLNSTVKGWLKDADTWL